VVLEGRDALQRWGFPIPSREQLHYFVLTRFRDPADADLTQIGDHLDALRKLRNLADYELRASRTFVTSGPAQQAIQSAEAALHLLDQIDGTLQRRNLAVAAIRAAFP
jgi:hypothetical protein